MHDLLKIFVFSFINLFVYKKIMGYQKKSTDKIVYSIFFSSFLAYLLHYFQLSSSGARFSIITITTVIFIYMLTKEQLELIVTGVVVAVALEYGIMTLSAIVSATILEIMLSDLQLVWLTIFSYVINAVLVILLFRIKRLKKGFLFLQNKQFGGTGFFICGIILTFFSITYQSEINETLGAAFIISLAICLAGIIIWWRNGLTKLYKDNLTKKAIQDYETQLTEKNEYIQKLANENELMATTIHRDNKLLPALHKTITNFIYTTAGELSEERQNECEQIISYLNTMMSERSGEMNHQDNHKKLASTSSVIIDGLLNYFFQAASSIRVDLDVTVSENFLKLTECIISIFRLETLLADLIENALHATGGCSRKRVSITFCSVDNVLEISVHDSGTAFTPQALLLLGAERTTTRAAIGGSGLGYMTVFEILRESGGSLIITEYDSASIFIKTITVRFDNRHEYIVKTYRAAELISMRKNNGLNSGQIMIIDYRLTNQ